MVMSDGAKRRFSNHVGKRLFRSPKIVEAGAAEDGNDHEREQQADGPDFKMPVQQRPAKAIDNPDQRIERVKEAPFFGDDIGGESDGRNVESKLHDERDDVTKIAIFNLHRREPQSGAASRREGHEQKKRERENAPVGPKPVANKQDHEEHAGDKKIDQAGDDGTRGDDEAGKIDFGDQVGVSDQAVARFAQGVGEELPWQHGGEDENRIDRKSVV